MGGGVQYDPGRNAVRGAEDHVCGLPRDTGQGQDLLHRARDNAAKRIQNCFARADDGYRSVAVTARRTNVLLEFLGVRLSESLRRGILLIERLGDLIHAHVGALRREYRGNQQLKWIVVNQRAGRGGIGGIELFENSADALRIFFRASPTLPTPRFSGELFFLPFFPCGLRAATLYPPSQTPTTYPTSF